VIHIYAPRKRKEACGSGEKPSGAETEPLEVLYPYDCRPPGVSENKHDNPAWHKAGRAILKAVAKNLERLNSEKIRIEPAREDGAFAEMLPASVLSPK
jgi:hypothetical protein